MSLIERFLTQTYEVTRSTQGTYQGGFYIPGATQTLQVQGSLQPLNAKELKLSEEGNRFKEYYKFYSDQPLQVGDSKTLADSDRISIHGQSYRVMSIESWQGTHIDLPYYKSIVYREPEQ